MGETLFYRCEVCGNIVALLKSGGGTLTCCGQAMTLLKANSTDGAKEKHVPVAVKEGGKLEVTVGSVAHPMIPEHFIEWIAFASEGKLEFVYLKPGMEPKAVFVGTAGGTVYAYCNLHGLWKTEVA
jgi:superoxide reductase